MIATNDDAIHAKIRDNLTWRIVDNAHWNRVGALGQALLESRRFGKQYAKQVVKNAKKLGKELDQRGFPVMFKELGFTESHQILIDAKRLKKQYAMTVNDFSIRLEKSNLIIDSVARLGASEITRMGVKERDIPELADLFMEAAEGKNVRKRVKSFRERFDMAYVLP